MYWQQACLLAPTWDLLVTPLQFSHITSSYFTNTGHHIFPKAGGVKKVKTICSKIHLLRYILVLEDWKQFQHLGAQWVFSEFSDLCQVLICVGKISKCKFAEFEGIFGLKPIFWQWNLTVKFVWHPIIWNTGSFESDTCLIFLSQ